jgi:hypothetical protein
VNPGRGRLHRWGNPDKEGVRACNKEGCTVRTARTYAVWQKKAGGHWRMTARELIPDCQGVES